MYEVRDATAQAMKTGPKFAASDATATVPSGDRARERRRGDDVDVHRGAKEDVLHRAREEVVVEATRVEPPVEGDALRAGGGPHVLEARVVRDHVLDVGERRPVLGEEAVERAETEQE